jgi:hypothetical protein
VSLLIKKKYKYIELKKLINYYSFFWFFEKGVATPGPWGWQECYGPWELYSRPHQNLHHPDCPVIFFLPKPCTLFAFGNGEGDQIGIGEAGGDLQQELLLHVPHHEDPFQRVQGEPYGVQARRDSEREGC